MRTDLDIYKQRFALHREPPAGVTDLREYCALQLEEPFNAADIWGSVEWNDEQGEATVFHSDVQSAIMDAHDVELRPVPFWRDFAMMRSFARSDRFEGKGGKFLKQVRPVDTDIWNPLVAYARTGDRPVVARIALDAINRCPTSDTRPDDVYLFWVWGLWDNLLADYPDYLRRMAAPLSDTNPRGQKMYAKYLNAGDNKPNPANPDPDQNMVREALADILGVGQDVMTPEDLDAAGWIFAGNDNGFWRPEWQQNYPQTILGQTFEPTPGSTEQMEAVCRFIAMHSKTAVHQVYRLCFPLLGRNLTPNLHGHLADVWLNNNGSIRAVLTEMFLHDDAWNPERQTAVDPLFGWFAHMCEFPDIAIDHTRTALNNQRDLGYDPEWPANPIGQPIDESVLAGANILKRAQWPGSPEQRLHSMSLPRLMV